MSTSTPPIRHMFNRSGQLRRVVLAAALALVSALSVSFAMASVASASAKHYDVCVMTGTVAYAGTDSDVSVSINGTNGTTGYIRLDDARDNFERGTTDCFSVWSYDVGRVTSITVWTNGSQNWFLSQMTVLTADYQHFTYNNWVPYGYTHIWAT